jgi:hypothetical protein
VSVGVQTPLELADEAVGDIEACDEHGAAHAGIAIHGS